MKRIAIVLALFAAPLFGQIVSPETPLSPPLFSAAGQVPSNPAVATDGDIYLAVWQNAVGGGEIYAARISRDGALLDQTGIPVAIPPRSGEKPQVAWTGDRFVVVWQNGEEIRATAISRDGAILGEEVIGRGWEPWVSCTTTRCLATWAAGQSPNSYGLRVWGRMLDSRGVPLQAAIAIADFNGIGTVAPRSATNGSNFLVAWEQILLFGSGTQLVTALVGADGSVTNHLPAVASNGLELKEHAVASNGDGYLLLWIWSGGAFNQIGSKRLDAAGNGSFDTPMLYSSPFPIGATLRAARLGTGYLVLFNQTVAPRNLLAALRVSSAGALLDAQPLTVGDLVTGGKFGAASIGSKALVVWPKSIDPATPPNLQGALVESNVVQTSLVISQSAAPQVSPAVAIDGQTVMTVWSEAAGPLWQVRTSKGLVHPSDGDQRRPAIAFNGSEYLVAWTDVMHNAATGAVMAKRLDRAGQPIAASELQLSAAGCVGGHLAVGSNGLDFVVAWSDCLFAPSRSLSAVRVSGGVPGAPHVVAQSMLPLDIGSIAWNGGQYLLAWLTDVPAPFICDPFGCLTTRMEARRLGPALEDIDGFIMQLGSSSSRQSLPRVVWNGNAAHYVVFWIDLGAAKLFAARFTTGSGLPSPVAVANVSFTNADPEAVAAAFDGSAAVVVWSERTSPALRDLWMARVRFDTSPWIPFRVTGSFDDEFSPTLAAFASGDLAMAYVRAAHEKQYAGANRVFLRTISGCTPVTITALSPDAQIPAGGTAALTASATGAVAFQWYRGESGNTNEPLPGLTTSSVSVKPATTTHYWLRALNACGAFADSATVTVTVIQCQPPAITAQPHDAVIPANSSAVLTVVASGTALSYQWYVGAPNDFRQPVGGNSPSLTTPPITAATQFWVRINGQCGAANSIAATVRPAGAGRRRATGQ